MTKRKTKTNNKIDDGTFGQLKNSFWEIPAWREMSKGAMWLYFLLRRCHNHKTNNNSRIFLSQRQAAQFLNSHTDYITRWFQELQYYGFIVMTSAGSLGVNGKGRAPRWRLTELPCNGEPATREFLNWNGVAFKNRIPSRKSGTPRPAKAGQENGVSGKILRNTTVPQKRDTWAKKSRQTSSFREK